MSGILFVVATPIGNLGDITLRALETLKSCDKIIAEDTRVTKKLLDRYEIRKPLISLRARSARAAFERVAALVEEGETLVYVTDAGTPGISDPGPLLVSLVREKCGEAAVVPIPGAAAVTAAVSAAGIPIDEFTFVGFLPHKKGRQKMLDTLVAEKRAAVLYESPHRMKKLLDELSARVPERSLVIARELTKLHEQIAAGTVRELAERYATGDISPKGEFVVILGAA
ncbi:MAG: 16S rRNA (cytidine(1402)-2'-O)-methyltransferase [Patescibacteria group bacterium]|nr:16S rRNA (cytidine(1402)-2'-O)-methyltransferase [Patescibacteria group bacterium]